MVKFKCIATGNVFEFKYEVDIASMRKHPEYVEVSEESKEVEAKQEETPKRKYTRKSQE